MNRKDLIKLTKNQEFIDFYCIQEDKWLQYADWEEKPKAIFGSLNNAKKNFHDIKGKIHRYINCNCIIKIYDCINPIFHIIPNGKPIKIIPNLT
jgi:hypothetical protein